MLTRLGTRLATTNIAISRSERADLEELGTRSIALVPCSVDTEFYEATSKDPEPLAVIVAQLNEESISRKGVDVAIQTAALLQQSHPTFKLIVVGPGSDQGLRLVRRIIVDSGATNVSVAGQLSRVEKRNVLARSWFYLQPSQHEGFGLAVLEAMSCQAIPVCSRSGALPEVVGNGGKTLEHVEPEAIANVIGSLIDHEDSRRRLQAAARAQATRFDRGTHIRDLDRVFRSTGLRYPGRDRVPADEQLTAEFMLHDPEADAK